MANDDDTLESHIQLAKPKQNSAQPASPQQNPQQPGAAPQAKPQQNSAPQTIPLQNKPAPNIPQQKPAIARIHSGIDGLDELIEGGLVKDSTILIRGSTGTGKTIFCMQFLYQGAAKYNEPGIYISFSESKEAILQHAKSLSWDMEALIKNEKLVIERYEPHEMVSMIEEGGGSLRDTVESIKAKRIVIDSLSAYQLVFENGYKASESILALLETLKKWDVTALVTSESQVSFEHEDGGKLGFLTDGIINLYHAHDYITHRSRLIEVVKMRDTAHDQNVWAFTIEKEGIKVLKELKNVDRD